MNLVEFEYPPVTGADMAFPVFHTIPALLAEAKWRGFYNGNTLYNRLFSALFFRGGRVVFKKDLPEGFKDRAWPYLQSFMGSWSPKHEEKEAICAMLLSELTEPQLEEERQK